MAEKLFQTKDRDESHGKLEQVLAEGEHPRAECRERDEDGYYTVWSGPQNDGVSLPLVPVSAGTVPPRLHPEDLSALADMIVARMKAGGT